MKNRLCAEIRSYIYNLNLTDKTSNEKQHLCRNLFLYIISTPYNHLLPHFWFYLRYKTKVRFGLYMLSFNRLCFISTPYNHSLPRFWFYLRYKTKVCFGLYMLSFNCLCFISTPYNRLLTCTWFNLRYK